MSADRTVQVRIFAATWAAYAGYYLCRKNFSVLMPLLKSEPGITTELLAHSLFVYSCGYSAGQLLMGLAADRFGARRVATAGMLVSACATAALAFFYSPLSLLLLQGVNGVAQACGWPALVKLVTHAFGAAQRGVVMAWWCSNYVFGAFIATVFATFAATGPVLAGLGWQRGALFPAALLTGLGILFWLIVRDAPPAAVSRSRSANESMWEVFRSAEIQTIAIAYFFIKLTRYTFLFWLPLYMVERLGYSAAEAGYTSSVYELTGFAGVLLSGYLSDRAYRGRRFPVGALFLLALAAACLAYPPLSSMSRLGNWTGIALLGILTFGPDTLMGGAATQDAARPEVAATAAGFVNSIGSMGQLVSPLLVSFVVKAFGWDQLFHVFVACALCGALALATRWSTGPRLAPAAQEA